MTAGRKYYIKLIANMWCVMSNGRILECCDTRYEAERIRKIRIAEESALTLEEFDRTRKWESLWDTQQKKSI